MISDFVIESYRSYRMNFFVINNDMCGSGTRINCDGCMDKSLLIFIAIGLGALYLVTNFIDDIQAEDDSYKNNQYVFEHKYDQYEKTDSIGQDILVFENIDAKTQIVVWQASNLKQEFLELFPDYTEMKKFIKDRTRGDALQAKVLKVIDNVEGKFFSGILDAEQAKQMLDSLK